MKYRILVLLSWIISIIPINFLRVFFYKTIFNYNLNSVKIGFGCRIYCQSFTANNCKFGAFNSFVGPFSITFGDNCTIGRNNFFSCDYFATTSKKYGRMVKFGNNCNISHQHHFDIAGELIVGDDCWFAGVGTQIWTHGPGNKERNVSIGSDCYVGSSSLIGPGAQIGSHTLVAMGSVVTKKFSDSYQVIGGTPAKILQSNFDWHEWQSL